MKKKIGVFNGYFLPHLGGVERYTEKLVSKFKEAGYDIVIITTNHGDLKSHEVTDEYAIYRLPTLNLFKNRYPLFRKNKEYKNLIEDIKKENIDYYICNTRFHLTSLLGAKIAKEVDKEAILIEHGSNHFTVNNKVLDFVGEIYEHRLTNKVKKHVTRFYGVSERCNNWLKHFKINASGVFYNSIDTNDYKKFRNSKYKRDFKDKLVITFAGRIIKEKGILLLLEAFESSSKKHKDIVLVVAGDGPILEDLREKYKNKNIYFEGKLNFQEIMSLYNVTDIFCHPSMFPEGLPTAILEAGLMKCAVIGTDRGGTVEVITSDEYGIIIEENEEDLRENLDKLISDRKLIEKLKKNIHQRILDEFGWDKTARDVLQELEGE